MGNTQSSTPKRISDKFQHGLCQLQIFKFCTNLMDVLVLSMKNKSCVVRTESSYRWLDWNVKCHH